MARRSGIKGRQCGMEQGGTYAQADEGGDNDRPAAISSPTCPRHAPIKVTKSCPALGGVSRPICPTSQPFGRPSKRASSPSPALWNRRGRCSGARATVGRVATMRKRSTRSGYSSYSRASGELSSVERTLLEGDCAFAPFDVSWVGSTLIRVLGGRRKEWRRCKRYRTSSWRILQSAEFHLSKQRWIRRREHYCSPREGHLASKRGVGDVGPEDGRATGEEARRAQAGDSPPRVVDVGCQRRERSASAAARPLAVNAPCC